MSLVKIFESMEEAQRRLMVNKPQLLIADTKRICLVLRDGTLCAVQDKCSHNGESLSKGTVNYLGEIVCPWHGNRFDLKTGREAGEQSADLVTYPVTENNEGVFIQI